MESTGKMDGVFGAEAASAPAPAPAPRAADLNEWFNEESRGMVVLIELEDQLEHAERLV